MQKINMQTVPAGTFAGTYTPENRTKKMKTSTSRQYGVTDCKNLYQPPTLNCYV